MKERTPRRGGAAAQDFLRRQDFAAATSGSFALLAAKTETADKKDNFSRKQPSFRHLTYTTAPNISIFFTSYKFLQALKTFDICLTKIRLHQKS